MATFHECVLWALAVIFIVQSTEGCHSVNIILCVTIVCGHTNKFVLNIVMEFKLENRVNIKFHIKLSKYALKTLLY